MYNTCMHDKNRLQHFHPYIPDRYPADLTVSKRPGTSNRIEIHFAVFNHLYLCFSFMTLAETL